MSYKEQDKSIDLEKKKSFLKKRKLPRLNKFLDIYYVQIFKTTPVPRLS